MGDKYELFSVTYSEFGFRNHRFARYRLDIVLKDERQRLYYENYSNLVSFLKTFTHFLE